MEEERRRVVIVSVVTIGAISAAWILLTAFSLWWNVIRGFPWYRLLHHH